VKFVADVPPFVHPDFKNLFFQFLPLGEIYRSLKAFASGL